MLHTSLLAIHVAAGAVALVVGPFAIRDDARRFRSGVATTGRLSVAYRALVIGYRAELWWLIPLSALTYGLAVLARSSAARRFPGWTHGYVHGQGGSYIALVTALTVVALTVDGPVTGSAQLIPWLAPTAVGTVLIEVWRRHLLAMLPEAAR